MNKALMISIFYFILFFSWQVSASENSLSELSLGRCEGLGDHFSMCRDCTDEWGENQERLMREKMGNPLKREWHKSFHIIGNIFNKTANKFVDKSLFCKFRHNERELPSHIKMPFKSYICKGQKLKNSSDIAKNLLKSMRGSISDEQYEFFINQGIVSSSDFEKRNKFELKRITNSGEDFLFMHRVMIKTLNMHLTENGENCINPWRSLEEDFPKIGYQSMDSWVSEEADILKDPNFLKKISLNELGSIINRRFHQNFHTYYRGRNSYYMTDPSVPRSGDSKKIRKICPNSSLNIRGHSEEWKGQCDSLRMDFSSHVNPNFWRFHGYIDSFIDKWLAANNYSSISTNCKGKTGCYEWKDNWPNMDHQSKNLHNNMRNKTQKKKNKGIFKRVLDLF